MSNSTNNKYGALRVPTKVITGVKTRWSYANIWDPKAPLGGGTPKYSVSLIIPKDDTATVNKINAAIQAAYEEGQSKLKGNGKSVPPLSALKIPLRDGDIERPDDPAYAGCYFVNANSASKPGVVDADRQPIHRAFRSILRCIWQSFHQFLRLQCKRFEGHCLRFK